MRVIIIIRLFLKIFLFLFICHSLSQHVIVFQTFFACFVYIQKAWPFLSLFVLGSINLKNVYKSGFLHDQNGKIVYGRLFFSFIFDFIPILIGFFGMSYCFLNPSDLEIPLKYYFYKFARVSLFIAFVVFIYVFILKN